MEYNRYRRRRHRRRSRGLYAAGQRLARRGWLVVWWGLRDEERRLPWRLTAFAGYMALLLVLLLFLESLPTRPKLSVAAAPARPARMKPTRPPVLELTTLSEITPPLVDISYQVEQERSGTWEPPPFREPPAKSQPEFEDPFALFAPPKEQPEPEPKFEPEPEPQQEPAFPSTVPPPAFTQYIRPPQEPEMEPVPERKAELAFQMNVTDLTENLQFSEQASTSYGRGYFERPAEKETDPFGIAAHSAAETPFPWNKTRADFSEQFEEPYPVSWFERRSEWSQEKAPRQPPASSDRVSAETVTVSEALGGGLVLKKSCPAEVSEGSSFTYTLKLHNQGKHVVEYVRVLEEVDEPRGVLQVEPAARNRDGQLEWIWTDLEPGAEREMRITCQALDRDSALALNSTLEVHRGLATRTQVFIPDVVVSVTLPKEVSAGEDFPIRIEIANNSQKTFQPSDLRVQLLKGVNRQGETDLTTQVVVPGPGKSIQLPMTISTEREGEEILLEVSLNLEETLTVPVTAHARIKIGSGGSPTPQASPASPLGKSATSNRLATHDS